ncbi:peptidase S8/S53 domain-containing protein [Globomyces pollinis-pini]|nr:peptidase S8/S53 domain-containing protein [Globomyces pollinis-pini]
MKTHIIVLGFILPFCTTLNSISTDILQSFTIFDEPVKKYIVSVDLNISNLEWNQHKNWLIDVFNETSGMTISSILEKSGLDSKLLQSIPISDSIIEQSIKLFRGILGSYELDQFKGYHGEFPTWCIQLLQKLKFIKIVEEDQRVTFLQTLSQSSSKSFQKFENTKLQVNPAWNLDRISHRGTGFEGRYIYPSESGKDVDIYILDTGVNIDHENFSGRAKFGTSFSTDGPTDVNGHGTHVAGVAASTTYGVAKDANIIAVKVLNDDGFGTTSSVMDGISWAIQNAGTTGRRSVINLSLGGGKESTALNQLVTAGVAKGIAFAVAAGNARSDACKGSPQNLNVVMTVAASNEYDEIANFSNYGKCVSIFAPGTNITSTSHLNNIGTRTLSGTSQSSPHVAGLMAIIMGIYPDIQPMTVYNTILQTATEGKLNKLGIKDPNKLLFNGIPSPELTGGSGNRVGNDFSFQGGGWTLVKQMVFSSFL